MARAQNKEQLINAAEIEFARLKAEISTFTADQLLEEFQFEDRDRNVRDVIVHLLEWHRLLLNWVHTNAASPDAAVPFLPAPYNWKTYGTLNVELWEKHQNTSLEQALAELESSHHSVLTLIDSFSDSELFTKKHFSWTGSTSLGSYCVSATSSHYVWAVKKLKQHKKAFAKTS